jgi:hypothetical protein
MSSKHLASDDDGERDRAVDRLRAAVAERSRARKTGKVTEKTEHAPSVDDEPTSPKPRFKRAT